MTGADGDPRSSFWLIGRDYGETEQRMQRPFQGQAGTLLTRVLTNCGMLRERCYIDNVVRRQPPGNEWRRHVGDDVARGVAQLQQLLRVRKPRIVVALGNEAFRTCMGQHPDDQGDLPSITDARGYLWDSPLGVRVLPAVHPAAVLREYVPWRPLLEWDMRKARKEHDAFCPPLPQREVRIVTSPSDEQELREALRKAPLAAFDIENDGDLTLSCLGVAVATDLAYVIPGLTPLVEEVCRSDTPKVFQNGMYDRYFLKRRHGIAVKNVVWDTMLAWHALQPELAGMKDDSTKRKRMRRKTQKGLRFLASVYTREPFWKDYDFTSEMEQYTLCGKDCCVTLEIAEKQRA